MDSNGACAGAWILGKRGSYRRLHNLICCKRVLATCVYAAIKSERIRCFVLDRAAFVLDVVDPVFLAITSRGRGARNKEISCQINSQEKICVANKGGDAHAPFLRERAAKNEKDGQRG